MKCASYSPPPVSSAHSSRNLQGSAVPAKWAQVWTFARSSGEVMAPTAPAGCRWRRMRARARLGGDHEHPAVMVDAARGSAEAAGAVAAAAATRLVFGLPLDGVLVVPFP